MAAVFLASQVLAGIRAMVTPRPAMAGSTVRMRTSRPMMMKICAQPKGFSKGCHEGAHWRARDSESDLQYALASSRR